MRLGKELTLDMLKEMTPNSVFASGFAYDSPDELNVLDTGRLLRWVAQRGQIYDWAIYFHIASHSEEWVKRYGDKVYLEKHIKRLVPCTEEALNMYRH